MTSLWTAPLVCRAKCQPEMTKIKTTFLQERWTILNPDHVLWPRISSRRSVCLPTQWRGWMVASYYKGNFSVVSEDAIIISECVWLVCVCVRVCVYVCVQMCTYFGEWRGYLTAKLNHSDLYCAHTHTHTHTHSRHQNIWTEPVQT